MQTSIKQKVFLCIFIFFGSSGYCQSIQPYVDFLATQHTSPVDYVMGLFDRYDVVIIGERNHPEMTQYDLINQIISSPEFIEKVGHIMTEVGSNNYTDSINKVLSAKYPTEAGFEKELIGVLRECEVQVLWPRTNFWQLLKSIHSINQTLPRSRHLDITFLNPAWSWPEPESISLKEFEGIETATDRQNYDVILAENSINALYEIFKGPRKKALVILNVPHHLKACKYWPYTATACIMSRFPGRVANVKLNNYITHYDQDGSQILPVADGKWDAAFAATGDRAVGFDFTGSPFGKDGFDGYDQRTQIKQEIMYQDMFDGFIFYNSTSEMANSSGIPGLIDEDFVPELLSRYALRGISSAEVMEFTNGDILKVFNEVVQDPIWENDTSRKKYNSIVFKHMNPKVDF